MFSFGACACASAPGGNPMHGIPLRPMMDTPLVEKVHLSVQGRAFSFPLFQRFRNVFLRKGVCKRLRMLLLLCDLSG